ncbi:MAG: hypothetical protein OEV78_02360 [Spirochaetia bacterium]|nr:hypothetical protein [Spirochaetia bacterium]
MKNIFLTFLFLISGFIYAGPIKDKFLDINDKIDKTKLSDEEKNKTLEENVNRALKMTLLQQFNLCGYEKAQVGKEGYEVSDINPSLVYIQYEKFVGYYLFSSNPTNYLQYPSSSKVLLEPGSKIIRSYEKECTDSTASQK